MSVVRRSELVRRIAAVPPPPHPRSELEQFPTPPELAADLVLAARADGLLEDAQVLDLGAGSGRLAIAAALAGAARVDAVEIDPALVLLAREAAAGLEVEVHHGSVIDWTRPADLVIMNPPFGAQRRHADRPFWTASFRLAREGISGFALSASRGFVAARAREAGARVERLERIPWPLERSMPYHRRARVIAEVDRWDLRPRRSERLAAA